MQNSPYNLIAALTNTYTTNIISPTAGQYLIIKHIRVVNKTGAAATFRLFRGLTGANTAGTEFVGFDQSVAANASYDWYGSMLFSPTDFLVGGASAATTLTIEVDGEKGLTF